MNKPTLNYERRGGGWWITDCEVYDVDGEMFTDLGPYNTKDECREAMAALKRFYQEWFDDRSNGGRQLGLAFASA